MIEVIDNIDGYPDTSVLFEEFEEIFRTNLDDEVNISDLLGCVTWRSLYLNLRM